jgi:hypothetical protein
MERFKQLKPVLRSIVINTILDSDPNEEPDPRVLAKRILKQINSYDINHKSVKPYERFFSKRVQEVSFKTFELR